MIHWAFLILAFLAGLMVGGLVWLVKDFISAVKHVYGAIHDAALGMRSSDC